MGEWPHKRIKDVALRIGMGPFGSSIKVETFVPQGVPIILGSHLHATRLVEKSFKYVTEEHAERLQNSNVYRGDVVFTHRGTIGQCSYIPENSKYPRYIVSQSQFYMRCDTAQVLPEYVAYYFGSHAGQYQLLANSAQIGVPSIARPSTYLRDLLIPIPPIAEQRKITEHLGALDDKIELNRRMNATIEAMARALFQSWFVDFDPVRAKAEGRQPVGMDAETAALFPDSFEESALGPIPKGWAPTSVNEIFNTRNTRVEPDEHKDHLRYVALDDMRSKSIGIDSFRAGSEVNSSIIEFTTGDVLFGAMRPYFHKVGLAHFSGITRTTTFVLVPKDEWLRYYGLFALSTDVAIEYATSASIGTTIPYVTWDALGKYKCTLAPPEILKAFSNSVGDLLARMTLNIASVAALTGARDTLLPKLLSGELRVGDVAA